MKNIHLKSSPAPTTTSPQSVRKGHAFKFPTAQQTEITANANSHQGSGGQQNYPQQKPVAQTNTGLVDTQPSTQSLQNYSESPNYTKTPGSLNKDAQTRITTTDGNILEKAPATASSSQTYAEGGKISPNGESSHKAKPKSSTGSLPVQRVSTRVLEQVAETKHEQPETTASPQNLQGSGGRQNYPQQKLVAQTNTGSQTDAQPLKQSQQNYPVSPNHIQTLSSLNNDAQTGISTIRNNLRKAQQIASFSQTYPEGGKFSTNGERGPNTRDKPKNLIQPEINASTQSILSSGNQQNYPQQKLVVQTNTGLQPDAHPPKQSLQNHSESPNHTQTLGSLNKDAQKGVAVGYVLGNAQPTASSSQTYPEGGFISPDGESSNIPRATSKSLIGTAPVHKDSTGASRQGKTNQFVPEAQSLGQNLYSKNETSGKILEQGQQPGITGITQSLQGSGGQQNYPQQKLVAQTNTGSQTDAQPPNQSLQNHSESPNHTQTLGSLNKNSQTGVTFTPGNILGKSQPTASSAQSYPEGGLIPPNGESNTIPGAKPKSSTGSLPVQQGSTKVLKQGDTDQFVPKTQSTGPNLYSESNTIGKTLKQGQQPEITASTQSLQGSGGQQNYPQKKLVAQTNTDSETHAQPPNQSLNNYSESQNHTQTLGSLNKGAQAGNTAAIRYIPEKAQPTAGYSQTYAEVDKISPNGESSPILGSKPHSSTGSLPVQLDNTGAYEKGHTNHFVPKSQFSGQNLFSASETIGKPLIQGEQPETTTSPQSLQGFGGQQNYPQQKPVAKTNTGSQTDAQLPNQSLRNYSEPPSHNHTLSSHNNDTQTGVSTIGNNLGKAQQTDSSSQSYPEGGFVSPDGENRPKPMAKSTATSGYIPDKAQPTASSSQTYPEGGKISSNGKSSPIHGSKPQSLTDSLPVQQDSTRAFEKGQTYQFVPKSQSLGQNLLSASETIGKPLKQGQQPKITSSTHNLQGSAGQQNYPRQKPAAQTNTGPQTNSSSQTYPDGGKILPNGESSPIHGLKPQSVTGFLPVQQDSTGAFKKGQTNQFVPNSQSLGEKLFTASETIGKPLKQGQQPKLTLSTQNFQGSGGQTNTGPQTDSSSQTYPDSGKISPNGESSPIHGSKLQSLTGSLPVQQDSTEAFKKGHTNQFVPQSQTPGQNLFSASETTGKPLIHGKQPETTASPQSLQSSGGQQNYPHQKPVAQTNTSSQTDSQPLKQSLQNYSESPNHTQTLGSLNKNSQTGVTSTPGNILGKSQPTASSSQSYLEGGLISPNGESSPIPRAKSESLIGAVPVHKDNTGASRQGKTNQFVPKAQTSGQNLYSENENISKTIKQGQQPEITSSTQNLRGSGGEQNYPRQMPVAQTNTGPQTNAHPLNQSLHNYSESPNHTQTLGSLNKGAQAGNTATIGYIPEKAQPAASYSQTYAEVDKISPNGESSPIHGSKLQSLTGSLPVQQDSTGAFEKGHTNQFVPQSQTPGQNLFSASETTGKPLIQGKQPETTASPQSLQSSGGQQNYPHQKPVAQTNTSSQTNSQPLKQSLQNYSESPNHTQTLGSLNKNFQTGVTSTPGKSQPTASSSQSYPEGGLISPNGESSPIPRAKTQSLIGAVPVHKDNTGASRQGKTNQFVPKAQTSGQNLYSENETICKTIKQGQQPETTASPQSIQGSGGQQNYPLQQLVAQTNTGSQPNVQPPSQSLKNHSESPNHTQTFGSLNKEAQTGDTSAVGYVLGKAQPTASSPQTYPEGGFVSPNGESSPIHGSKPHSSTGSLPVQQESIGAFEKGHTNQFVPKSQSSGQNLFSASETIGKPLIQGQQPETTGSPQSLLGSGGQQNYPQQKLVAQTNTGSQTDAQPTKQSLQNYSKSPNRTQTLDSLNKDAQTDDTSTVGYILGKAQPTTGSSQSYLEGGFISPDDESSPIHGSKPQSVIGFLPVQQDSTGAFEKGQTNQFVPKSQSSGQNLFSASETTGKPLIEGQQPETTASPQNLQGSGGQQNYPRQKPAAQTNTGPQTDSSSQAYPKGGKISPNGASSSIHGSKPQSVIGFLPVQQDSPGAFEKGQTNQFVPKSQSSGQNLFSASETTGKPLIEGHQPETTASPQNLQGSGDQQNYPRQKPAAQSNTGPQTNSSSQAYPKGGKISPSGESSPINGSKPQSSAGSLLVQQDSIGAFEKGHTNQFGSQTDAQPPKQSLQNYSESPNHTQTLSSLNNDAQTGVTATIGYIPEKAQPTASSSQTYPEGGKISHNDESSLHGSKPQSSTGSLPVQQDSTGAVEKGHTNQFVPKAQTLGQNLYSENETSGKTVKQGQQPEITSKTQNLQGSGGQQNYPQQKLVAQTNTGSQTNPQPPNQSLQNYSESPHYTQTLGSLNKGAQTGVTSTPGYSLGKSQPTASSSQSYPEGGLIPPNGESSPIPRAKSKSLIGAVPVHKDSTGALRQGKTNQFVPKAKTSGQNLYLDNDTSGKTTKQGQQSEITTSPQSFQGSGGEQNYPRQMPVAQTNTGPQTNAQPLNQSLQNYSESPNHPQTLSSRNKGAQAGVTATIGYIPEKAQPNASYSQTYAEGEKVSPNGENSPIHGSKPQSSTGSLPVLLDSTGAFEKGHANQFIPKSQSSGPNLFSASETVGKPLIQGQQPETTASPQSILNSGDQQNYPQKMLVAQTNTGSQTDAQPPNKFLQNHSESPIHPQTLGLLNKDAQTGVTSTVGYILGKAQPTASSLQTYPEGGLISPNGESSPIPRAKSKSLIGAVPVHKDSTGASRQGKTNQFVPKAQTSGQNLYSENETSGKTVKQGQQPEITSSTQNLQGSGGQQNYPQQNLVAQTNTGMQTDAQLPYQSLKNYSESPNHTQILGSLNKDSKTGVTSTLGYILEKAQPTASSSHTYPEGGFILPYGESNPIPGAKPKSSTGSVPVQHKSTGVYGQGNTHQFVPKTQSPGPNLNSESETSSRTLKQKQQPESTASLQGPEGQLHPQQRLGAQTNTRSRIDAHPLSQFPQNYLEPLNNNTQVSVTPSIRQNLGKVEPLANSSQAHPEEHHILHDSKSRPYPKFKPDRNTNSVYVSQGTIGKDTARENFDQQLKTPENQSNMQGPHGQIIYPQQKQVAPPLISTQAYAQTPYQSPQNNSGSLNHSKILSAHPEVEVTSANRQNIGSEEKSQKTNTFGEGHTQPSKASVHSQEQNSSTDVSSKQYSGSNQQFRLTTSNNSLQIPEAQQSYSHPKPIVNPGAVLHPYNQHPIEHLNDPQNYAPQAVTSSFEQNAKPVNSPQTYTEEQNSLNGDKKGPYHGTVNSGPANSVSQAGAITQRNSQQGLHNVQSPEQSLYSQGRTGNRISKQYTGSEQQLKSSASHRSLESQEPTAGRVGSRKPMLVSVQIVSKDTDVHTVFPGEKAGLPPGLHRDDMTKILYTFNYTVGFNSHFEEGYKNGVKKGYYYVTARNGVRTRIDYTADDKGFYPKVSQEILELISDNVPKPETEKDDKFGLKNYEFKWSYNPVGPNRR